MIRYVLYLLILFSFSCKEKQLQPEEVFRPSLHFSAKRNWTGEPTGLVCFEGKYHIFYQYNENGSCFGPISWGHAVSEDLIHWEQLPVAIPYDSLRHAGSGSVVADEKNTSGFQITETVSSPFIAFYTKRLSSENQEVETIYLSYSLDKGNTWKEYSEPVLQSAENPVLRYPKVKWNKCLNCWLMTVSTGNTLLFYTSQNCKEWRYHSKFEHPDPVGGWESSDLFPLTDSKTQKEKWILLISMASGPTGESPAVRYFVGDFNESGFHSTQADFLWTDYGYDNYAAMTFNNLHDGRTILLVWMNCWNFANLLPTKNWKGNLSLPREIGLSFENNRLYLLTSSPVKELDTVWKKEEHLCKELEFKGEYPLITKTGFESIFEINLNFDVSQRTLLFAPSAYGIRFKTQSGRSLELGYNAQSLYFYIDPSSLLTIEQENQRKPVGASYILKNDTVDWKIVVDKSCIEFFASRGKVTLSSLQFSREPFVSIELFSMNGKTRIRSGNLRSY